MTTVIGGAIQGPSAAEIREQVRQSIQNAVQGAREATLEMRQERFDDAIQRLHDAESKMRVAHTNDQIFAAEQSLNAAKEELNAAKSQLDAARNSPTIAQTVQPPMMPMDIIPPQAVDIAIGFFVMVAVILVGRPLSKAFGRRIDRSAQTTVAPTSVEQLTRIEQAVEAMAIEVERISESQRFMAKLQNAPLADQALQSGERR
jgi:exonuclease VII large subunit